MRPILPIALLLCATALPVPAHDLCPDAAAHGASKTSTLALEPQVLPVEPYVFTWSVPRWPTSYGVGMYEMLNPGVEESIWETSESEPWLIIQDRPFHDSKGESTYLYFGVDPKWASPLAPGDYPAEITFTLAGDGRSWTRQVVMQVVWDPYGPVSADQDRNWIIGLSELLRLIQFYNATGYRCALGTEDGHAAGAGTDHDCVPTSADYSPQDWRINLSELLRYIQIYNAGGYDRNEDTADTEDGIAPITY